MSIDPGTSLGPSVLLSMVCMLFACTAIAQTTPLPPIGTIDFYGLQTVSEEQVRALLPFTEGDALPSNVPASLRSDLAEELRVTRVAFNVGCCDQAGTGWVYVGIEDTSASHMEYRATPTGSKVLAPEILASYRAFGDAALEAATRGELTEDGSAGHAFSHHAPARAVQEKFVIYADQHDPVLRQVLRDSADAEHRAAAAMVLGYARDKASIVPDLEQAVRDPDAEVRNNAARALWVIGQYANHRPELEIRIRADPFIDMLSSVVFTDRNKGLGMLWSLTMSRDPGLLRALSERALPSLIEMCRWKNEGHAHPACRILERMVELPEQVELHPKQATITKAIALLSSNTEPKR